MYKTTQARRAERLGNRTVGVDKDYGTSDWGTQLNPSLRAKSVSCDGTDLSPEAEATLRKFYPNTPPPKRGNR